MHNRVADVPETLDEDEVDGEAVKDSKMINLEDFLQKHTHDEILERLQGVQLGNN